jgi:hypothetical protein
LPGASFSGDARPIDHPGVSFEVADAVSIGCAAADLKRRRIRVAFSRIAAGRLRRLKKSENP